MIMKYIEITDREELDKFLADESIAIRDIRVTETLGIINSPKGIVYFSSPVYHLFYYQNKQHEEKKLLQKE